MAHDSDFPVTFAEAKLPGVASSAEPPPLFRFREALAGHVAGSQLLVHRRRVESGRGGLQAGLHHLQRASDNRTCGAGHSANERWGEENVRNVIGIKFKVAAVASGEHQECPTGLPVVVAPTFRTLIILHGARPSAIKLPPLRRTCSVQSCAL